MKVGPAVLVAHPGTQHAHFLVEQLETRGLLYQFHTCLSTTPPAFGKRCAWARLFRRLGLERQWQNRLVLGIPANKLNTSPRLELAAWVKARLGVEPLNVLRRRNDAFQRRIPETSLLGADAVIGFDTSSNILGHRAQEHNKPFLLDRSIGEASFFLSIARELEQTLPEWCDGWQQKPAGDVAREDDEHALAQCVVVPSRFVAETLVAKGVDAAKIRINPYGVETDRFYPVALPPHSPFVFLFAGALQARKGLATLLAAWCRIGTKKAELWVAGPGVIPSVIRAKLPGSVKLLGPVPRGSLPAIMQQAQAFVFPSFFEGLARVQLEAAACGLPIIGTVASGASEIVEDGVTGWIVEPGDEDGLVEKMQLLLHNRNLLRQMRRNAADRSAVWSWDAYGARWARILSETV